MNTHLDETRATAEEAAKRQEAHAATLRAERDAAAVKTESSEDMHAATVAARLRPSRPGGSRRFIMSGSA